MNRETFLNILESNQGVVVAKFGATWCGPCRKIEPYLQEKKKQLPDGVVYYSFDADTDENLYALFKFYKQVRGVPVLLAFKKGNKTPFADKSVTGADKAGLDAFFNSLQGLLETEKKA